ncbi:hypothetical protein HanXRQr2_Chr00c039g0833281 [Helianthus annuus]|uniref:Uncharacterized protein n=1 Tax=Helianthus annuus TaxID=4232 RepID=A0A9K3JYU0_HELAN|nr:hypothetical protein HanXRQr2_Chr00c039g0833281 [Helianthus annuus]
MPPFVVFHRVIMEPPLWWAALKLIITTYRRMPNLIPIRRLIKEEK